MNDLLIFAGFFTLILFASAQNRPNDYISDIEICGNCDELRLRNASTNFEDPCHEVFNYTCIEIKIPKIKVITRKNSSQKVSKTVIVAKWRPVIDPEHSNSTSTDYKSEMELIRNVTMANLRNSKKKYSSKVIKLKAKQSKSWQKYPKMSLNKADIYIMNHTFTHLFSKQRNNLFDFKHKENVRAAVLQLFQSYGFKTEVQKFAGRVRTLNRTFEDADSRNLIGILPSENYQKEGDRIIVVGAHYDTVYLNPGIEDNGSGSVLVLETARLMSHYLKKLNTTIYFVLFDQEESGLEGSIAFVREYLIPKLIEKQGAEYVGGFITDMCLVYDPTPNSQKIPRDFPRLVPEAAYWIGNNSFQGDFISIWARDADLFLGETFQEAWNTLEPSDEHKLLVVRPPFASSAWNVTREHYFSMFYRSDHASFWLSGLYSNKTETLPVLRINDLGIWRGYQSNCYHRPCDSTVQLTEPNLRFMARTIDALATTLKLLAKKEIESREI